MIGRTWLEIIQEHSEEIYRKSALLSHLTISELGMPAGSLKGVPASSFSVSPHHGNKNRTRDGTKEERKGQAQEKSRRCAGRSWDFKVETNRV